MPVARGLALLLTAYVVIYIGFVGRLVVVDFLDAGDMAVHELSILIMFFAVCGECAEGGAHWTVLQVLLHIAIAIPLSILDPLGAGRGSDLGSSFWPLTGWTRSWQAPTMLVYMIGGALLRLGALYDCQQATSFSPREQWWFRVLIVMQ
jgi:hypothetical protein